MGADTRLYEVPKLTICAIHFTENARRQICKAGGECITFDKLALRSPLGKGTVLLKGPVKKNKLFRYWGKAPGVPHSNTRPKVRSKAENSRRREAGGSPAGTRPESFWPPGCC